MKTKVKRCKTLKEAENFQNSLYNEYDHVKLVGWPRFSENGLYIIAKAEGK